MNVWRIGLSEHTKEEEKKMAHSVVSCLRHMRGMVAHSVVSCWRHMRGTVA